MNFICPRCGTESSHPIDKQEGYCSICKDWTAVGADGRDRRFSPKELELYHARLRELNADTRLWR